MAKRQSLGRGLGALIPDVSRETSKPKVGTGAKPAKKAAKKATPVTKGAKKPATKTPAKPVSPKAPAKSAVANPVVASKTQSATQAPVAIAGLTFAELPVRSIAPNAQQPRQVFDDELLNELAASIAERGVLQPIIIRAVEDGFELVAGERRWRAAQKAQLHEIPAIIIKNNPNFP